MKKLMIAAAIVCAAVVSQAATVSWTASGIDTSKCVGDAYAYGVFSYASDESTDNVGAVASLLAMIQAGNDPYDAGYEVGGYVTGGGGILATEVNMEGGWGVGTKLDGYLLVLDSDDVTAATQYMLIDGKSVTIDNAGGSYTLNFGSQSANTWQAIAVPEPTSGLLLLLGVAGLALRRRRA